MAQSEIERPVTDPAAAVPVEAVTAGMAVLIAQYDDPAKADEGAIEQIVRDVLTAALPMIEWPPLFIFEAGVWAGQRIVQLEEKLADVRELAEALGDRSNEPAPPRSGQPVRIAPTDRRLMEPLRRALLAILDRP